MSDKPTALTPDEASAIEAISGIVPAAPAETPPRDEASEPVLHEEAAAETAHPPSEHGNEGGALHGAAHDEGHHDHHEASESAQDSQDAEMAEMKSTMLDSAELANRAAGMAAKAAGNMHGAST